MILIVKLCASLFIFENVSLQHLWLKANLPGGGVSFGVMGGKGIGWWGNYIYQINVERMKQGAILRKEKKKWSSSSGIEMSLHALEQEHTLYSKHLACMAEYERGLEG